MKVCEKLVSILLKDSSYPWSAFVISQAVFHQNISVLTVSSVAAPEEAHLLHQSSPCLDPQVLIMWVTLVPPLPSICTDMAPGKLSRRWRSPLKNSESVSVVCGDLGTPRDAAGLWAHVSSSAMAA